MPRLFPTPAAGIRVWKHDVSVRCFTCLSFQDAPLEPLMVIAGAAGVLAKDGFFAGMSSSRSGARMRVRPCAE